MFPAAPFPRLAEIWSREGEHGGAAGSEFVVAGPEDSRALPPDEAAVVGVTGKAVVVEWALRVEVPQAAVDQTAITPRLKVIALRIPVILVV